MKYKLEKSKELANWWVLTDTENLVVIRFKEHEFNETQKVSVLDESELMKDINCASKLAHIMSEMGDYMATRWYSVAMPTPEYEIRIDDETGRKCVIRNKFPKFKIEFQDDCDIQEFTEAFTEIKEFIIKRMK